MFLRILFSINHGINRENEWIKIYSFTFKLLDVLEEDETEKRFLSAILLIITIAFNIIPSSHYEVTSGKSQEALRFSSDGIILCTRGSGRNEFVPVEVNAFKPGDEVIFYNKVNVTRKAGTRLVFNLNWRLLVLDPFNFTVYEATSYAAENSSYRSIRYTVHFDWNVSSDHPDGVYQAILTIVENLTGQFQVYKALFYVYGALPKVIKYHLNYTVTLKNLEASRVPIKRLYIVKLPNIKGQQRILEGPIFSKPPSGNFEDQFGNRYAVFDEFQLGPKEIFNLTASYIIEVNVSYINSLEDSISSINRTEFSLFLSSQKYIESDAPEIISLASSLADDESNIFNIGKAIFNYVSTNIKYDEEWLKMGGEWQEGKEGALWTYRNKRGLCRHFAALFVALARAAGIPSVTVPGYGFLNLEFGKIHSYDEVGHEWALIYLPSYGWMPVDPVDGWWWGWSYGSSLPTHIIFNIGGFSKVTMDEGEAWINRKICWTDPSKVKCEDSIRYLVEPVRLEREKVSITMNATNAVYAGESFIVRYKLNKPIDGLVMVTFTSPNGRTYQRYDWFMNGENSFELKVPPEWGSIGEWNFSIAFPGDELHEPYLCKGSFNTDSAPSQISLTFSPESPVEGQPIQIHGFLNPPLSGEILTVTLTSEEGGSKRYYTETMQEGYFSLDISDDWLRPGGWTVNVSWGGGVRDLLYSPTSVSAHFEVQAGTSAMMFELVVPSIIVAVSVLAVFLLLKRRGK